MLKFLVSINNMYALLCKNNYEHAIEPAVKIMSSIIPTDYITMFAYHTLGFYNNQ